MLYTNEMIKNLGYKDQSEFVYDFIYKHKNCIVKFDINGVYVDYDWDTSSCVNNI